MKKKHELILALAFLGLGALGIAACKSAANITTVSAKTFEHNIEVPGVQLVDVRNPTEYEESHIEGARNINIDSSDFLREALRELKKDKPVYLYCRGGRRSMEAAEVLVKEGYKVVNLDGGLNNWKTEGLPVVEEK